MFTRLLMLSAIELFVWLISALSTHLLSFKMMRSAMQLTMARALISQTNSSMALSMSSRVNIQQQPFNPQNQPLNQAQQLRQPGQPEFSRRQEGEGIVEKTKEMIHDAAEMAKETFNAAKEKFSSATGSTKEKLMEAGEAAKEKLENSVSGETKEKIMDAAGNAKERVMDAAGNAKDKLANAAEQAKDFYNENVRDKGEALFEEKTEEKAGRKVRNATRAAEGKISEARDKLADKMDSH